AGLLFTHSLNYTVFAIKSASGLFMTVFSSVHDKNFTICAIGPMPQSAAFAGPQRYSLEGQ
ncbi:hypothetical protein, partial [Pseudomonas sp.]|uniref:hypothetical protein n=1 Tax=Pseudomonas sp. TaxID=306 RepID=UPI003C484862